MPVKKASTPARRRRPAAVKTVTRRPARRRAMGSPARRKSALKSVIEGAAGGAAADLLSSALGNVAGIPAGARPFVPLLAAFATDYFFKRPMIAAGMAGAGAGRALQAVGLGDDSGFSISMDKDPMALQAPANPMALQDYQYPGLSEGDIYSSAYANYSEI